MYVTCKYSTRYVNLWNANGLDAEAKININNTYNTLSKIIQQNCIVTCVTNVKCKNNVSHLGIFVCGSPYYLFKKPVPNILPTMIKYIFVSCVQYYTYFIIYFIFIIFLRDCFAVFFGNYFDFLFLKVERIRYKFEYSQISK